MEGQSLGIGPLPAAHRHESSAPEEIGKLNGADVTYLDGYLICLVPSSQKTIWNDEDVGHFDKKMEAGCVHTHYAITWDGVCWVLCNG